ncbi:F0F1 ATP synthase subunit epsilon [Thalassoglobus polymorphus]|uniref:ATP synthase epsilon chain n=1 Tax=Thalassoglobus polymorphus TaxID=2527994 RepID=A0A517QRU1_9PLAN|nr:F0F1 ATP synthase subunit epsilon [Thalassoglobus polymorphus]QDT34338.1 ATP synthase epsilon chain, sodium ion specific [Thalassoglobus polymorphus]
MIAATELRLVLVTPETTLLDQQVNGLRFPLFDGQIGVLPGRAPLVGRLGTGTLKFDSASGSGTYFLEGGFVQIKGSVVTLLTNKAILASEIDAEKASAEFEEALALKPTDDAGFAAKEQALIRTRAMKNLGGR